MGVDPGSTPRDHCLINRTQTSCQTEREKNVKYISCAPGINKGSITINYNSILVVETQLDAQNICDIYSDFSNVVMNKVQIR